MRILHAHNYYVQEGGEDTAFSAEVALLRERGHEVVEYVDHNRRIAESSRARVALQTIWSWESRRKIAEVLRRTKPDVAHFHNTFPLISPAAYSACRDEGVPVVQALDNPRLICPASTFFRAGQVCRACVGKTPPWPAVVHGCYQGSRLHSAVVAAMLTTHRWMRTWASMVDRFVVATDYYRDRFVEAGLPASKIVVKPHFIQPDPGGRACGEAGDYALFVGRLDHPIKGLATLLSAWRGLADVPLVIRGSGPLEDEVQAFVRDHAAGKAVRLLGRLSKSELVETIKRARFLVWPSQGYYETFGYVAVESFSCGVPVIASGLGVLAEVVTDGVTGLHFTPGDSRDLAAKVRWAWDHPAEMAGMGSHARREYEARYTAEAAYDALISLYASLAAPPCASSF